jgi:type IV secretion system protein VirB5
MIRKASLALALVSVLTLCTLPTAHAAMAVIDTAAIARLVDQYKTLQEQLTTAQSHLQALTGKRGMERLLAGTVRNYLPPDWRALIDAVAGAGWAYGEFSDNARGFLEANAILTEEELARLSPEERAHIEATRRSTAMLQALTQEALSATSGRFESIQQLIDAIPGASDPKAIMDLQARIQAEQGMLANDSSKLHVLFEAVKGEQAAQRLQLREQGIADVGSLDELTPVAFSLPEIF